MDSITGAGSGDNLTPKDELAFRTFQLGTSSTKNKRENKEKSADNAEQQQPEYEVERILGVVKVNGRLKYVIKWKGYDETTEEPLSNLDAKSKRIAQGMKKDYEKKGHGAKSGTEVCIFCVKGCIFCCLKPSFLCLYQNCTR